MDRKIPSESNLQPDSYEIDGNIIKGKVAAIKYVKQALDCSMTEAIKYVESL